MAEDIIRSIELATLAYHDPDILDTHKHDHPFFNTVTHQQFYNGAKHSNTDSQAYLWWCTDYATIYVAFRGTSSQQDMLDNLNLAMCDIFCSNSTRGVRVHKGMYLQFMAIGGHIMQDINKLLDASRTPVKRIVVCGHSLGGALATIAAPTFAEMFPELEISCCTIGSPRVGNTNFVDWFHGLVKSNHRVVNESDPVPMVPMSYRFTHVRNALVMNEEKKECKRVLHDTPWYVRLFYSAPKINMMNPIRSHNCKVYLDNFAKFNRGLRPF